ncbi:unnamed protein product [Calypogeia fissa]
MEDDSIKRLSALLQAAAFEYDAVGGATDNSSEANSTSVEGFCLSISVLSELSEFFQGYDARSTEISGLWEQLAEKRITAGGIVKILTRTMESGGLAGIKAADTYLCLLLVPGWPVYSLFSQMAFDSLARCLRNACKSSFKAAGGHGSAAVVEKGRRGQRKGKRVREKDRRPGGADEDHDVDQAGHHGSPQATVAVRDIRSLLVKLQKIALVLHFKERQETLKLIVGLLVDMLHLLSDMKEDEDDRNGTFVRGKKRAGAAPLGTAVPDIVFSTLGSVLSAMHGDPMTTAIMVLRALASTILLTHASGSSKVEIRNKAMEFVTRTLLSPRFTTIRPAVVALARYLCFKAPERTEGRSVAVDSVLTVLRASNSMELGRFSDFLCKFSHSKPRHRLVAVDAALVLLGGLPNPLKQNALQDYPEEDEVRDSVVDRRGNEHPEIVDQVDIDEEFGAEGEERDMPRDESDRSGQPAARISQSESQWWGITCFEILLHRCSDKAAAIRARSLTNLAQAIELLSANVSSRRLVQTLLGFNSNSSHGAGCNVRNLPKAFLFSSIDTPVIGGGTPSPEPSSNFPTATPLTPGAGHRDLWSLLQRRCLDEKAAVRKATFLLMKKSTALLGKAPDEAILQAMGAACGDSLISIRKAALSAFSEVMRRFPGDAKVAREWLKCALPLAFDNEQSLQDECLCLFEELVLDKITFISTLNLPKFQCASGQREASTSQEKQDDKVVERLVPVGTLDLLKEMADGSSISSCVTRICTSLGKKKRIRPGVALALQSLISAHRSPDGAWFLLSEVTAFVPKAVGWEFLRTHWKLLDKKDNCSIDDPQQPSDGDKPSGNLATWAVNRVHLLQTISNVAVELPPDAAVELATELLDRLKAFDMHPAEVGAHIKALATLCKRKALTAAEGDQLVIHWAQELLGQAENILRASLSPSFPVPTAADVFQTPTPSDGNRSAGRLTRSRSKHSRRGENETSSKQNETLPQIVTVIFTVGALALTCPQVKAGHVVTLLQTLLTRASGLLGHRRGRGTDRIFLKEKVTPEVNVHVRVALGKLCLADDMLARRCIPLFAQELGKSDLAAVRNNIMIIMTDFCVRYTALIDGYIHDLTRSLRDPCELVRRQAFVLLSRLLQRDYVKWRGMLFHRFLLGLVDESEKISQLARYVFGTVLKLKAPLLAYNSFVEAIFVLNDCVSQASSSSLLQIPQNERALFCLRGNTEDILEKRMKIYSTLLQQMVPEHLLATSAKLCAEILAAAADGLLDLNDGPSQCVLKDALRILASKELRIAGTRASAGNADLEEDDGGAAAAIAAVKGRVVTQLMKKNLVQNAVPIFIELKRLLESRNSPLLGLLMECMRVMLKDYKNEIEEILVADKQLQKEILYDMQKHDAAMARAKVAAAAAAIPVHREVLQQVSPGVAQTPAPSIPVSATPKQFSKGKTVAEDQGHQRSRGPNGGKENENPALNISSNASVQPVSRNTRQNSRKGSDILTRTPAFSSLRRSAVGALRTGDSRAGPSPRVAWQDQQRTPRMKIHSATPGSLSRQSSESHQTPFRPPHPNCSRFGTPRRPVEDQAVPSCSRLEDTCLAGAVADVAAASTVATVLQQVAHKSVTPFKAMSIPRLRPDISSINSALKEQQFVSKQEQILADDRPERSSSDGGDGLETVRRRQSFSSVDEPCGVISQSNSD